MNGRFGLGAGLNLLIVSVALGLVDSASAGRAPFTVENSVEWTRLRPIGAMSQDAVLFAPDRSRFLLHTRRGDIGRHVNVERLLVFESKTVGEYLSSASDPSPQGMPLAEIAVERDSGGIESIAWMDSATVGFIAEGDNQAPQVFVAEVAGGRARQLTRHANGVASFAVRGDKVVFYAFRDSSRPLVQAVDDRIIYSVIAPALPTSEPIELFELSRSSGVVRRVDLPAARISSLWRHIWLSPSGRYAIVLTPALAVPPYWVEYQAGVEDLRYAPTGIAAAPDSLDALVSEKVRYTLVDLERNHARPLLDAPSGSIALTSAPMAVHWLDGENSVVVAHTYLPLGVSNKTERARRIAGPAIAEIEVSSGAASAIAWEEVRGANSPDPVVSVRWDSHEEVLSVERKSAAGVSSGYRFQKQRSKWRQIAAPSLAADSNQFVVEVRQSLNDPPKVYVSDAARPAKLLLDPNPAADQLAFGRVERMSWRDANQLSWTGGLVYPTDYVAGRRYPLVLQTHGFRDGKFLLSGPGEDVGTAFSAQALANAGFIVLQAAESPAAITNDEREARLVAQGWRAAIQQLVDRNLVDGQRVGIIAFSRTCMHAIKFLAEYPGLAKAVTLADGPWWGYAQHSLLTNYPQAALLELERVTGGAPERATLQEWFDKDPLYKLAESGAAVRLEAMGSGAVVALWETFSVLRRAQRPVDMIYFPEGSHNLMKPAERLGSQGGNVDWFRFWLLGEEDPAEAKAAQYARWRTLRQKT